MNLAFVCHKEIGGSFVSIWSPLCNIISVTHNKSSLNGQDLRKTFVWWINTGIGCFRLAIVSKTPDAAASDVARLSSQPSDMCHTQLENVNSLPIHLNVQLNCECTAGVQQCFMFTLECEIHSHNVCLCIKSIALQY